jgi:hypothetical protein
MSNLNKERLDAAFEAYWASEGCTFKSIEAAIEAYLATPPQAKGKKVIFEKDEAMRKPVGC